MPAVEHRAPRDIPAFVEALDAHLDKDVIDRQLANTERNRVRATYNRAEYLDERRRMMQSWADHLDGLKTGAEVIPIRRARRNHEQWGNGGPLDHPTRS